MLDVTADAAVAAPVGLPLIRFPETEPPPWVLVWQEDDNGDVALGPYWVPVEKVGPAEGRLLAPPDLLVLPLYHALKLELVPDELVPEAP